MNPSSLKYLKNVRRRKKGHGITCHFISSSSNLSSNIFNYPSIFLFSSEAEAIRDHFSNKLMVYRAREKEGTEKVRILISTLRKSIIIFVKEAT